jgi:hypothetical protein
VASAACALLPFIPAYVVAAPFCLLLAAQGRLLVAAALLAAHLAAVSLGDTLILEDIPGSHPYLMSLAILGGMYAFSNPLLGCVMGPILLSLLSAISSLHSEFMAIGVGIQGGSQLLFPIPSQFAASGAEATPDGRGRRQTPMGTPVNLRIRVPDVGGSGYRGRNGGIGGDVGMGGGIAGSSKKQLRVSLAEDPGMRREEGSASLGGLVQAGRRESESLGGSEGEAESFSFPLGRPKRD